MLILDCDKAFSYLWLLAIFLVLFFSFVQVFASLLCSVFLSSCSAEFHLHQSSAVVQHSAFTRLCAENTVFPREACFVHAHHMYRRSAPLTVADVILLPHRALQLYQTHHDKGQLHQVPQREAEGLPTQ